MRDAVHLRHASNRVSVLHFVAESVRDGDFRGIRLRVEQRSESAGRFALARMRSGGVDVAVEGGGGALEDFEGEGGDDVGLTSQIPPALHALGAERRDELSSVDQGDS